MAVMSVAEFYAPGHWGNRFGVKGPMYDPVVGHKGQDINRHPLGTPIPSWTSGTVVRIEEYDNLGHTVILQRSAREFVGFAHMNSRSPLRLGSWVALGQPVGPLGNSGSATTGRHLHTTLEPTIAIGTRLAMDPLPLIKAAIAAPKSRRKAGRNVALLYTKIDGKNFFALAGDSPGTPANWLETRDQNLANQLAAQYGPAAYLTPASFQSWKSAYTQPLETKGGAAHYPTVEEIAGAVAGTFSARLKA